MIQYILAILFMASLAAYSYQPLRKKDLSYKKYGKISETVTGELVRSKGEKIIADTLTKMNIEFVYELPVNGMLCDYYLPQYHIYVEYWGMMDVKSLQGIQYRKSMKKKLMRYEIMKAKLISITPDDLNNIEKYLTNEIKRFE